MICYSKKFLFYHHGKCAGTSIKNAIKNQSPKMRREVRETARGHLELDEMYKLIRRHGHKPQDYFKFTIVRNPWDRLVSWYYHWIKINKSDMDFDAFAKERTMPYKHLNQMTFILQFEKIRHDWSELCRKLELDRCGLPHIQYSTNRPKRNYQDYFTDETRELTAKRHKEVIELFDYKF